MARFAVFTLTLLLAAVVIAHVSAQELCCTNAKTSATCAASKCTGGCQWRQLGSNGWCVPKAAKGLAKTSKPRNIMFMGVENPIKPTDSCPYPCGDDLCCDCSACHTLGGLHWCGLIKFQNC